jgi:hypothetical protein
MIFMVFFYKTVTDANCLHILYKRVETVGSSVVEGPSAGCTAASVARESTPLEAAAAVILSLTAAVFSLVIVSTALRPVVSGSGVRALEPAAPVPVAACAAEVLPSLVPGTGRVSSLGGRIGAVCPSVDALLSHHGVGAAPLPSGVRLLFRLVCVVEVDEITGQLEVCVEVGVDRVAGPAAADDVLLGLQILRVVTHDQLQVDHRGFRYLLFQDLFDFFKVAQD